MPDLDPGAQTARNRDTLLTARYPRGSNLKQRAAQAAKSAGLSVSAFVTAAVEKAIAAEEGRTVPADPPAVAAGQYIRIVPERGRSRIMLVTHVEQYLITLSRIPDED